MKKVFQNKFNDNDSNCLQAAVASLLDMDMHEVPNFIEFENWGIEWDRFWDKKGVKYYPLSITREEYGIEQMKHICHKDGGTSGFFLAMVNSLTHEGDMHAVIIDCDMNVVHDPNPNQLSMKLKDIDIIEVVIINETII